MTTAAVVLAAGGGARYTTSGGKGHKLLAPFMGWNVVGWSILSAVSAKLDATYVVVGAVEIPRIDGVRYVDNERWTAGLSSSHARAPRTVESPSSVAVEPAPPLRGPIRMTA